MATTIITRTGEVVATRFYGGKDVGCVIQMEINEVEWFSARTVMVSEEGYSQWTTFAAWVAEQTATIRWDSAERQNQIARDCENHRWASTMDGFGVAAAAARQRARIMVRDAMKVVR